MAGRWKGLGIELRSPRPAAMAVRLSRWGTIITDKGDMVVADPRVERGAGYDFCRCRPSDTPKPALRADFAQKTV